LKQMSRGRAFGFRLSFVALLIIATVWGSLWAYVEYKAHRASLMLAEVSQVHVGDIEASVVPLVQRYGGFKWKPKPLPPREDWIDRDEYDYQKNRVSDYKYELGLSPFGTIDRQTSRLTRTMRRIRAAIPPRVRPVLGMRDWGTVVELSVRDGRVQSVSAMTLFAGRSGWLGHSWLLAEGMPSHEMRPRAYIIGEAFLTMEDGGGTMIENVFTPEASEHEVGVARQFNTRCLASIKGCDGLCDVAPRAIEHLKQQPDAAWNIFPPKCP
jgi:hypothetical protein